MDPLFTVGEQADGCRPPGLLDGIGALRTSRSTVSVLVPHEVGAGLACPYRLASGTRLTGARIIRFEIDRWTPRIDPAGLAGDSAPAVRRGGRKEGSPAPPGGAIGKRL